ncbi:hybrid sensor histidine kinase/response regulator [Burkholderia sp. SRS-W-2-2016]|uniref:PAS domain S-box protein n=1 Tax=Burkholderia sp. SRS-W-2-2016 TaxID=1926878 RepID=UPI00094B5EF8|nr:PAS domain-containing sensor histidine kinase [Burkholderia sp. SRS-W-2-2016]OLL28929.1 hybrid sensor histidine kinase/response regulator [Burkholderia sp. SRS-W-2-2016]
MRGNEQGGPTIPDDWCRRWVSSVSDYAVIGLAPDGTVRTWNVGGESIHGFKATEVIGQSFEIFHTEEDRRQGSAAAALDVARRNGRVESEGWRVRKNGSRFWANVVITVLRDDHGNVLGFGKIVRDMTDKRRAHEAVVESERRFRMLVNGVTDYAIFMLSPEGIVTNWNAGARRIKGYDADEIIGSHFSRFYTPDDAKAGLPQRGLSIAAREGRFEAEGWRVRKDGRRFWAHVVIDAIRDEQGELAGFAKITRDITERMEASRALEQTRAALFQAQKMEAVGKLTGGVAHDFNNVLQVLRGNLELLDSRHHRDAWTRDRVYKAIDAVERGSKLASQLLAFGRQQPLQPVVINLAAALRGMDDLLRRALDETVSIETVVAGGLWNTLVDIHQLENVVLNLAINARDAMPQGGKLTMELSNAMLDDDYVASVPELAAGQYVLLAVTDTGTGMPPDVKSRAFDPFFTTKPEGRGTGLGLSTAYGFVKQSGGHIGIYSEPGHGTTIKIYLPRSTGEAVEPPPRARGAVKGGTEVILVVEDDRKVQSTAIDTLTGLGYRVLKADDAQEALTVLRSGVDVDLLFSDVVMPGPLRSPEMAAQAVLLQPNMKVLFTSGYTQNAIVHGGRLDPGVELLSKPYSREQLARKIRQLLDKRGAALAAMPSATAPAATPAANTQALRILLVDDDANLSDAVKEQLALIGHATRSTTSPNDALQWLAGEPFDVLITDLKMPGIDGIELAKRAAAWQPSLCVVFSSGYEMPLLPEVPFRWAALRKPFAIDELGAVLRGFQD